MSLLRLLNPQGIAGFAISLALATLLLVQKVETAHWKSESGRFERLYAEEQSALAGTVANYRAAAEAARAADQANLARVTAEQRSINERTEHDYETRLAAARAAAQRLRVQNSAAAAGSSARRAAPLPGLSAASGGIDEAAGQDELPRPDALVATEQAIQLDELIEWLKAQSAVDPNADRTHVDSARP